MCIETPRESIKVPSLYHVEQSEPAKAEDMDERAIVITEINASEQPNEVAAVVDDVKPDGDTRQGDGLARAALGLSPSDELAVAKKPELRERPAKNQAINPRPKQTSNAIPVEPVPPVELANRSHQLQQ